MLDLEKTRQMIKHFDDRRTRAKARLGHVQGRKLYFALCGFLTDVPAFDFEPVAWLRPVEEPPGEAELASSLKNAELFSTVGRWSRLVTHELAVDRDALGTDQGTLNVAWGLISALRMCSGSQFIVPAYCDHSWSTVAAFADNSCHVQVLEDYPKAIRIDKSRRVLLGNLEWVDRHFNDFSEMLLTVDRFRISVGALTSCCLNSDLRIVMATLWSGLDAIFGINLELKFRISLYAACMLEPPGPVRRDLFRRVKKLYDVRSKAVHGAKFSNKQLMDGVQESQELLSRLLCRMVELGRVPNEDDFDDYLLMPRSDK